MKQLILWKRGDRPSGLFALVDDEDFDFLEQFKWWAKFKSNTIYVETRIEGKLIKLHSLLLNNPAGSAFVVDHINHNGLDNQRHNLRLATHAQNMANSQSNTNTSGFRGVMWRKDTKKWAAGLCCKGVKYHLGYFETKEAAARAYNVAAIAHFGEFAKLNEF